MSGTGEPIVSATPAEAWQRFHAAQEEVLGWMTGSDRYAKWPQHRAKAYHEVMETLAHCKTFLAPLRLDSRVIGWNGLC